jgi:hypothetical protein
MVLRHVNPGCARNAWGKFLSLLVKFVLGGHPPINTGKKSIVRDHPILRDRLSQFLNHAGSYDVATSYSPDSRCISVTLSMISDAMIVDRTRCSETIKWKNFIAAFVHKNE